MTENLSNQNQIQPSKPKGEITETTKSQITKRKYGQPSEQLFSKRWPLSNMNRTKNMPLELSVMNYLGGGELNLVFYEPNLTIGFWNGGKHLAGCSVGMITL